MFMNWDAFGRRKKCDIFSWVAPGTLNKDNFGTHFRSSRFEIIHRIKTWPVHNTGTLIDTYNYATQWLPQCFHFNNIYLAIFVWRSYTIQTSVLFKANVYRSNRYAVLQIVNYDLSKQNVYSHIIIYYYIF